MSHMLKVASHWGNLWKQKEGKQYFEKEESDYLTQFKFAILRQYLDNLPKNAKVLEIGCGNSFWLRLARKYYPQFNYYGVDISDDAVRISRGHGITATKDDATSLSFKNNSFDLVFSWGVVEHFPKKMTAKAIQEHIRITKRFCLIETPNKTSLGYLEFLVGNWLRRRDQEKVMVERGLRYSPKEILDMAEVKYIFEAIPFCTGPVLPLYKFLRFIDILIPNFIRRRFGCGGGIAIIKK